MKTSKTSAPRSHVHNQTLIDVDNLTVHLGGEVALDNVSVCVHAGEFIGIVGANGAGKTTLLRAILGLVRPSSGKIVKQKSIISYIPQNGNLYNGTVPMSVMEVVKLGSVGSTTIAQESLNTVGMVDFGHRRFTDLSGGQRQRVAIAKALASSPDILILDEPTTGIDERSQTEFYDILHSLQDNGITIITVGHEVETLTGHASRIICLNRTVVYDGPPESFDPNKHLPTFYKSQHQLAHHGSEAVGEDHHA